MTPEEKYNWLNTHAGNWECKEAPGWNFPDDNSKKVLFIFDGMRFVGIDFDEAVEAAITYLSVKENVGEHIRY